MKTDQNNRARNLEFKIAFSETNLRWLASEPDSEEKRKSVVFNTAEIKQARAELADLAKMA